LGAMDPVDSNRYTCEPQARRKNEGEGLGSFTDDGGARAAVMARRPALQSVAKAARAQEGVGAWECAKGGYGGALGRLYRLGVARGGASPAAMAINGQL
jgi:hypothetical protein